MIHYYYILTRGTVYFFFNMLLTSLLLIPIIGIYIENHIFSNSNYMVRPPIFATKSLQSDVGITDIVGQINILIPQLADFINQFHTTVNQTGISVVSDTPGNLSIDVPSSMTNEVANEISKKIGIIDRLITTRGQQINDLLQTGISLENKLKMENPQYVSQLTAKIEEFKRLNSIYKH